MGQSLNTILYLLEIKKLFFFFIFIAHCIVSYILFHFVTYLFSYFWFLKNVCYEIKNMKTMVASLTKSKIEFSTSYVLLI